MFNLNKEIKAWKSSLRKYQSMEDGYIDELGNHLRDEIDSIVSEGKSLEEAFTLAVKKMGDVEGISSEYYRTETQKIYSRPPWKANRFLPPMLSHYLRIGVRQLTRNKGYTFINILGLAVGLACVILLTLFVQFELSYDSYNVNKERLYRAYIQTEDNGRVFNMAPIMLPFAPAAKEEVPGVEAAVRLSWNYELVKYKDKSFFEAIRYVDEDLFKVFTIDLLEGDAGTLLDAPDKIVISDEMANKYFGKEPALGKVLRMNDANDYLVSGVFKKQPVNTSYRSNFFASISTLKKQGKNLEEWGHFSNDYTFILLNEGVTPSDVEAKLTGVLFTHMDKEDASQYKIKLQNITDVHFSNLNYDQARSIPITYLYVFGSIALFILVIACINFINLSTARASRRNREVGIRKSIGARKGELIWQFLSEATVYVSIAFLIGLAIVYFILPDVNGLLNCRVEFFDILKGDNASILFGTFLLTSILSGGYPAFYLAKIKPVLVLKSESGMGLKKNRFREILVVAQFGISAFLIIGTTTIYQQLDFMINQNLGFYADEIAVIPLYSNSIKAAPEPFANNLLAIPGIANVSFSSGTPASGVTQSKGFKSDGVEDAVDCQYLRVDDKFFDTYGIHFLEGRGFNNNYSTDEVDAILINKTAAKSFGWKNPLGKKIFADDTYGGTVIGVIDDFNYSSVKTGIEPLIIQYRKSDLNFCSVKFDKSVKANIMDKIEEAYSELTHGAPFEGYLMKEEFLRFYRNESRIGQMISIFAAIAIIISCLGILGLVSFMAEQKRKEIGIRKVLGASISSVLQILGKQFIKWVVLANLIVIPLAYYALENWLNDFAVRIDFTVFPFIVAAGTSLILALLTVGYHVIKAALTNPVEALKYE